MLNTTTALGGRLPLAQRSALTGAKLELFDRFVAEAVPWAQREGFVAQSADGTLIGPFNRFSRARRSPHPSGTGSTPRGGTPRSPPASGKS
jgi:hypothetical protein